MREILKIIAQKAKSIREANTYRGRVNNQAEQAACFIDDLYKEVEQFLTHTCPTHKREPVSQLIHFECGCVHDEIPVFCICGEELTRNSDGTFYCHYCDKTFQKEDIEDSGQYGNNTNHAEQQDQADFVEGAA